MEIKSTRRSFLANSAWTSGMLSLGFLIPWNQRQASSVPLNASKQLSSQTLQTFVTLHADNRIEIAIAKAEMGQGVATSLAMLIAEDLEADWQKVEVRLVGEQVPYYDPITGGFPATFGSTSVRSQYEKLRLIGASVRDMLLLAAANRLKIAKGRLFARHAVIYDESGRALFRYGELIEDLRDLPIPENPQLKQAKDFKLIGQDIRRKDSADKIEGKAIYGLDVKLPNMLHAAVKHHPVFGAKLKNFSDLITQTPRPYQLVATDDAILIIGPSYWQAQQIADGLRCEYEMPAHLEQLDQAKIETRLQEKVESFDGYLAFQKGSGVSKISECDQVIESEYFAPFLAHGAMEPLTCTGWVRDDLCEFWIPTQSAQFAAAKIAQVLNRPIKDIKVHVTFLGGGFGRKVEADFVAQTAHAAKLSQQPVKLIWSRAEDTQHDFYRPAFQARLQAGIKEGQIVVWNAKSAGPSISRRANPAIDFDPMSVEGFANHPYHIPHQNIFHEEVDLGIPVGYWRSVGKSQNTFFVETFIDELAVALKSDPLQLRLDLLKDSPRGRGVLKRLASFANWYDRPDQNQFGIAFMEGFGSFIAIAVKVRIIDRQVKVDQIYCVVDCGRVIHPDGAKSQVEGASLFGLAATLYGKITIRQGRVEQNLYGDTPFLKLEETPEIFVDFIENEEKLGGLGETATPLVAPAVVNGIYRVTGQRVRRLPLSDFDFKGIT